MALINIKRNHLIGLLISITSSGVIALFYFTSLFDRMEKGAIDTLFYLRDPAEKIEVLKKGVEHIRINQRAHKDIIVIGIDGDTVNRLSNQRIQWPYPWDIHAMLTRYIGTGMPSVILFDVMFIDHKKGEHKLSQAIREAKNVFLDYSFILEQSHVQLKDIAVRLELLKKERIPASSIVNPHQMPGQIAKTVEPPTPLLLKAAKGAGFANVFPDPDHTNRMMPLLLNYNGALYPSIDLLVILQYYGITKSDIEIKFGEYIKLKNVPLEKMSKPNSQREIKIPIDQFGFIHINFIGGVGSFGHQPYWIFLRDGNMQKEGNDSLKNKIILVGIYSVAGVATDEKHSPYGPTFGIEHHAHAINTVLTQDFINKLTDMQNLILMLIIAVIIGLIFSRISIISSLVFALSLIITYSIGTFLIFYFFSLIPSYPTPIIQISLTFSIIVTYRVLTEQKEKKFIKQTFSKFVSHEVVDELLKNPEKLKLGGEKKIVTVLFSDIRGFTSMSEKMSPEKLVDHLNHYLQEMTDIVIKFNGTLDKYMGDAIMAFWGAPIPQDDHALRACKAAVEMIIKLDEMNRDWKAQNKETLAIGIGINTGEPVVGFVGSSSRMDYTLMGDMANLGSRLEGANKNYKTGIIISEFTHEHVKEHTVTRELDLIRVKGKDQPVKIYELLDIK